MFNKTFVFPQTRTEHVPYEKSVVEHRAPTDDSIRIWEEMKERAYKSIIDSIELRDNALNLNAIMYKEAFSHEKVCKYRFSLNGHEITGEVRSSILDLKNKMELYLKIVDDAARHIAVEIVKSVDSFRG